MRVPQELSAAEEGEATPTAALAIEHMGDRVLGLPYDAEVSVCLPAACFVSTIFAVANLTAFGANLGSAAGSIRWGPYLSIYICVCVILVSGAL